MSYGPSIKKCDIPLKENTEKNNLNQTGAASKKTNETQSLTENNSSFKIFQIEKNNEDIRKTVLMNTVKMLTERGLLKKENLEGNIKMLTSVQSDDYSYTINLDNYKDENDKSISLKIMHQKITAISKQSTISEFLIKNKDVPKIIIVKNINTKAIQYISTNFTKTEIFLENELMINLIDNVLVPKYELIDRESETYKNFCSDYKCKKKNVPRALISDPVARYYNLKKGDLVRVIRPSETSVNSPMYRLII